MTYRNYRRSAPRRERKPQISIEPARGATYGPTEESPFAAYEYGTYDRSSVLAGQTKRIWLDSGTLEELKAKFPGADVSACSNYQPPALNHLPGDDDPDPHGDWQDQRFGWDGDNGGDR